jgi:hypothetical protein
MKKSGLSSSAICLIWNASGAATFPSTACLCSMTKKNKIKAAKQKKMLRFLQHLFSDRKITN